MFIAKFAFTLILITSSMMCLARSVLWGIDEYLVNLNSVVFVFGLKNFYYSEGIQG